MKLCNIKRLLHVMRWQISKRLETEQSQVLISKYFEVTLSVVSNLQKQFKDTGSTERKSGQSHSRATMTNEDLYLALLAKDSKNISASQISRDFYAATGSRALRITVCRWLHDTQLFAIKPSWVLLTFLPKRIRLKWCNDYNLYQRPIECKISCNFMHITRLP